MGKATRAHYPNARLKECLSGSPAGEDEGVAYFLNGRLSGFWLRIFASLQGRNGGAVESWGGPKIGWAG